MSPAGKIRIVLADDHQLFRSSLRLRLETQMDMEVVAEAEDCALTERTVATVKPDVLLLDVSMPGGCSIAALPRIQQSSPETKILVLTAHSGATYLKQAIHAGAAGYMCKTCSSAELLSAVRAVHRGQSYVSVADGALQVALSDGSSRMNAVKAEGGALSEREQQVLKFIAYGHTYKEIAHELSLSVKTVETYRSRLSEKLGLRSRADIVRYALDHRILRS